MNFSQLLTKVCICGVGWIYGESICTFTPLANPSRLSSMYLRKTEKTLMHIIGVYKNLEYFKEFFYFEVFYTGYSLWHSLGQFSFRNMFLQYSCLSCEWVFLSKYLAKNEERWDKNPHSVRISCIPSWQNIFFVICYWYLMRNTDCVFLYDRKAVLVN